MRILFVCLGNICRSPMAEGVLRARAAAAGLDVQVDSAGIGAWQAGSPPDPRAIATAARRGYDISGQRARKIASRDYRRFDLVLAMTGALLREVEALRPPGAAADLDRFLSFAPALGRDVADPYYVGGFDRTLLTIEAGVDGLIARRLQAA